MISAIEAGLVILNIVTLTIKTVFRTRPLHYRRYSTGKVCLIYSDRASLTLVGGRITNNRASEFTGV